MTELEFFAEEMAEWIRKARSNNNTERVRSI